MASEMCGCRLPTIICPSVSSPPACPALLAVPLPWGSGWVENKACELQHKQFPPSIHLFLEKQVASSKQPSLPCKPAPFLLNGVPVGLLHVEVKRWAFQHAGMASSDQAAVSYIAVPRPLNKLSLC